MITVDGNSEVKKNEIKIIDPIKKVGRKQYTSLLSDAS